MNSNLTSENLEVTLEIFNFKQNKRSVGEKIQNNLENLSLNYIKHRRIEQIIHADV